MDWSRNFHSFFKIILSCLRRILSFDLNDLTMGMDKFITLPQLSILVKRFSFVWNCFFLSLQLGFDHQLFSLNFKSHELRLVVTLVGHLECIYKVLVALTKIWVTLHWLTCDPKVYGWFGLRLVEQSLSAISWNAWSERTIVILFLFHFIRLWVLCF
jgi:hypothetical protein